MNCSVICTFCHDGNDLQREGLHQRIQECLAIGIVQTLSTSALTPALAGRRDGGEQVYLRSAHLDDGGIADTSTKADQFCRTPSLPARKWKEAMWQAMLDAPNLHDLRIPIHKDLLA